MQEPSDCSPNLPEVYIADLIENMAPVISLDSTLATLLVETTDASLKGSSTVVQIKISDSDSAASQGTLLLVSISFKNQAQFNMSSFRVGPLTCSLLDATWFMTLPEVLEPEIQTVSIKM